MVKLIGGVNLLYIPIAHRTDGEMNNKSVFSYKYGSSIQYFVKGIPHNIILNTTSLITVTLCCYIYNLLYYLISSQQTQFPFVFNIHSQLELFFQFIFVQPSILFQKLVFSIDRLPDRTRGILELYVSSSNGHVVEPDIALDSHESIRQKFPKI